MRSRERRAAQAVAARPEAGGRPNRPNYLVNSNPDDVTPSNENDYVRDRNVAAALGKALFWDMQVGSDGVQACGTCHFTGAGIDTRTRNQINPNHLGLDNNFELMQPNERDLVGG
jgi:cytochrome c peroxidase